MHELSKLRSLSLSLLAAAAFTWGCGDDTPTRRDGAAGSDGPVVATEAGTTGGAVGTGGVAIDSGAGGAGGAIGTGGVGIDAASGTGGAGGTGGVAMDAGGTGTGGVAMDGGTRPTGGTMVTGGSSGRGGATGRGGTTGAGGTQGMDGPTVDGGVADAPAGDDASVTVDGDDQIDTMTSTVDGGAGVCRPASQVLNDFSNTECIYGDWVNGQIVSGADVIKQGTSTVSATCGNGWKFSGLLGAAADNDANAAAFGLNLFMGSVNGALCSVADLSAYRGVSITLSSATGAPDKIVLRVHQEDGTRGEKEISVPTTATAVTATWAELGVSTPARVVGISGVLVNKVAPVTVDLVITRIGLLQ